MVIREYMEKLSIPREVFLSYQMDKILFFDIETTGFDKEKSNIILISGGWFIDGQTFLVKQYFAEATYEEKDILRCFKEDAKRFHSWCSYNGKAFDEPFILKKSIMNNIKFITPKDHIDLYRIIRPYQTYIGLERCSLKSVEEYLGIERKDKIDGGLSIELYYEFLETKESSIKDIIMLHNLEDVLNLPQIFELVSHLENDDEIKRANAITEKQLKYLKYLIKKNNIILELEYKKVSKKAAGKIIDNILKGNINIDEFNNIVNNSY